MPSKRKETPYKEAITPGRPFKKYWTTTDELHCHVEALNLLRCALKTLSSDWGEPGNKTNVAYEVSNDTPELAYSISGLLRTELWQAVADYHDGMIQKESRPTAGVFGPLE